MHFRRIITLGALVLLSGCNLFSGIDSPSGDQQLLSAARGCFDRQDYQCAMKYYQQLSGSDPSTAAAGEAFVMLDEQGASMGAIMDFVGNLANHDPGYSITKFAETLVPGSGENKRVAIWNGYNNWHQVTADPTLQSFVRFIAATSLTAEILAEAVSPDGVLHKTDLANSPSACHAAGSCALSASCDAPAGTVLTAASGTPNITTTSPTNANPSLDQLEEAISEAYSGLSGLGASGNFGSASNIFNTIGGATAPSSAVPGTDRCFRQILLSSDIGD